MLAAYKYSPITQDDLHYSRNPIQLFIFIHDPFVPLWQYHKSMRHKILHMENLHLDSSRTVGTSSRIVPSVKWASESRIHYRTEKTDDK